MNSALEIEKLRVKAATLQAEIDSLSPAIQEGSFRDIRRVIHLREQLSECLKAIGIFTVGRFRTT